MKQKKEIEDFKYEFDFSVISGCVDRILLPLFIGYVCLHQFVKQDIEKLTNRQYVLDILKDSLEKDEELIEVNNMVTLKLNTVNQGIIEYVKFILKYGLIVIKDFTVENNILKWRILDEN